MEMEFPTAQTIIGMANNGISNLRLFDSAESHSQRQLYLLEINQTLPQMQTELSPSQSQLGTINYKHPQIYYNILPPSTDSVTMAPTPNDPLFQFQNTIPQLLQLQTTNLNSNPVPVNTTQQNLLEKEQYQAVEIDVENGKIRITYTEEAIRRAICARKCPSPTCGKWIQRKGDFEKHLWSHYEGKKMEQEYHCPVSGCYAHNNYVGKEKTHFANTKYVKQHYVKRHGAKVYSCQNCEANKYPTLPLLHQHQKFCKKSEKCSTCGKKFKINKLEKHSLETGHTYEKEKVDNMLGEIYSTTTKLNESKVKSQFIQLSSASSPHLPQKILPKVHLTLHTYPPLAPSISNIDVGTQTEHHSRGSSPSKRSNSIRTSHCQTEKLVSVNTGTLTSDLNYFVAQNGREFSAQVQTDPNSPLKKLKPKRKKHHEAQTYNITKRRRSSLKKLDVQSTQTQTRPGSNAEVSWPSSTTMAELFQEEWDCPETTRPSGISLFDEFTGISEVETQTEDLLSTNDPLLANLGSDDIGNYLETMDSETQTFLLDTSSFVQNLN